MSKKSFEDQWAEIEQWFDWGRVEKVMTFLEWEWFNEGIPDIPSMKRTAKRLLAESYKQYQEKGQIWTVATGGFEGICHKNGDIELKFSLENWRVNNY